MRAIAFVVNDIINNLTYVRRAAPACSRSLPDPKQELDLLISFFHSGYAPVQM